MSSIRSLLIPRCLSFALAWYALAAPSAAQPWWWPPEFVVNLVCSSGCIDIAVSGLYPDSCAPQLATAAVEGSSIFVEVVASYGEECPGCADVITSWNVTSRVSNLEPGREYAVFASFRHEPLNCQPPVEPTRIGAFTLMRCVAGDIDCSDDDVTLADLALLLAQFGCTAADGSTCTADTDGDCDVDLGDLTRLLSNFGCAAGECPSECP